MPLDITFNLYDFIHSIAEILLNPKRDIFWSALNVAATSFTGIIIYQQFKSQDEKMEKQRAVPKKRQKT
jgi:hypothetical protein